MTYRRVKGWKRKCKVCGIEFIPSKKGYSTCSNICGCKIRTGRTAFKQKEYNCFNCGESIFITPNTRNQRIHVFCSRKCYGAWKSEDVKGERNVMFGKTHSDEVIKKQSDRMIKKIKDNVVGRGTTRSGKREDLGGVYMRSSWEANIARCFNRKKWTWRYEPKTFYFKEIKRGTMSYTPDFYITKLDKWIEVKGWMDPKSKIKLKRFKKYFPEDFSRLTVIVKNNKTSGYKFCKEIDVPIIWFYDEFEREYSNLKRWEKR